MRKLDGLKTKFNRFASDYDGKWTYALTDLESGEHIAQEVDVHSFLFEQLGVEYQGQEAE